MEEKVKPKIEKKDKKPEIQKEVEVKKEIQKNNNLIKTISAITDGKQVAIIKYIINNLDKDNLFIASYTDIMESFSISKPTLIKLFKELAEKNILIKVQHKTYRFNEQALESL